MEGWGNLSKWRLENGLWRPDPEALANDAEGETSTRRPRADLPTIVQAVATALAVVVVLPSLWLNLDGLREQREINSSQQAINSTEQERFHRRYVDLVTWWVSREETRPPPGRLIDVFTIQNQSAAPLHPVYVELHPSANAKPTGSQLDYFYLSTVPPCTALSVHIPSYDLKLDSRYQGIPMALRWEVTAAYIRDPSDEWRMGEDSRAKSTPLPEYFAKRLETVAADLSATTESITFWHVRKDEVGGPGLWFKSTSIPGCGN